MLASRLRFIKSPETTVASLALPLSSSSPKIYSFLLSLYLHPLCYSYALENLTSHHSFNRHSLKTQRYPTRGEPHLRGEKQSSSSINGMHCCRSDTC